MNRIYVKEFSEYPGLRHCSISDKSGEEYYHKIMNKTFKDAFEKGKKLTVNLDGTAGYATSFLDEAFGNLIFDFGEENVKKFIVIESYQEPDLKEEIEQKTYPQWEQRRKNRDNPKKTCDYTSRFRLVEGKVELVPV